MEAFQTLYLFLLSIGIVQGVVFGSILLFGKSKKKTSNRFLATLLLFLSYHLLSRLLWELNLTGYNSILYYIFLEYNWIYGPLIYFYIVSYLDSDYRFRKQDWKHFIPVGIEAGFSLFVKIQNVYWDGTRESLSWAGENAYVLWMHTPFQYVVSSVIMFYYAWKAKRELKVKEHIELFSSKAFQQIAIILNVYLAFSAIVFSTCLIDYIFFNYAFSPSYIFPVFITQSILIYWHGLVGFSKRNEVPESKNLPAKPIIDPQDLKSLKPKLVVLMEDKKAYLAPTLTLQELAEMLDIKPYILTQLLNREFSKSFSTYVAEYRVNHVIQMMREPKFQHYTLLALAFESGFNSKASFNRVFKKIAGKSPKEAQKELSDGSFS